MTRLLSAQRRRLLLHRLHDVSVSDRTTENTDSFRGKVFLKRHIAHDRGDDSAPERSAPGHPPTKNPEHDVPVDHPAFSIDTENTIGVAVVGYSERGVSRQDLPGERSHVHDAEAVVDVQSVRLHSDKAPAGQTPR